MKAMIIAVAVLVVFGVSSWAQSPEAKKAAALMEQHYGAFGKTTDEILSHENATNRALVLGALVWRINQKSEARGEGSLTDTERKLSAVSLLEAEVANGGFDQYFTNSAGNDAEVALAGLNAMGATGKAAIMERAMAVFPGGKPPAERSKRQKVMQQIEEKSESVWEKCDNEYYKLKDIFDVALAYAKKKKAEIILP